MQLLHHLFKPCRVAFISVETKRSILSFLRHYRWVIPVVIIIALLPVVGLAVILPLFRTTPPDFDPPIRISLVNYFQANALANSGKEYEEKEQWEDAERAWTLAFGTNPGQKDFLRKTLSLIGKKDVTPQSGQKSEALSRWLLRLSSTNHTDLELVLKTLERNRRYGEIGRLANNENIEIIGASLKIYLRSLFHSTQYQEFLDLWNEHKDEFENDPLMQLYFFGVGCVLNGKPDDYEAFARARAALDPDLENFHHSLQIALRAHGRAGREDVCRGILSDLVSREKATLLDHLCYWQVLIGKNSTEGIEDYYRNSAPPVTETEVMILLQTLYRADLKEVAAHAAEKALTDLGSEATSKLYLTFGNLLAANKDWQRLNELKQDIDDKGFIKERIGPDAIYWETLTALNLGKVEKAVELSDEIVKEASSISHKRRFTLALKFLILGQTQHATELVKKADELVKGLDGKKQEIRYYWQMRIESTTKSKGSGDLVEVAKAAYESDPEHIPHLNNYVVALIINRSQPELALELSRKVLDKIPNATAFRLNHAHALCLNSMWDDVSNVISEIQKDDIKNPIVANDYALVKFRMAVGSGDNEEITRLYDELDMKYFAPKTIEWVEKVIDQIRTKS